MFSIHEEIGKSPLFCLACKRHLTKARETTFHTKYETECFHCGASVTVESGVGVKVLPSSEKFLKVSNTRNAVWYHSTRTPKWESRYLDFDIPVYIGTRSAALRRYEDCRTPSSRPGWLYKIKLKKGAPILRKVLEDDYCNPDTGEHKEVVRYVNMFESVGSISVVSNPEYLEVIDRQELK